VGEHPNAAEFLRVGQAADLQGIHFVVTLDADTQLPHDTARAMIETLAHPLNRPRFDPQSGIVTGGYGIIQPRVSTALPSAIHTRFSRLFTDARGTDPYTHLISNVYQDLSGEGAYHGKGIYDLHAFHRVLNRRFPEATLLSHDLIEGAHVRVGLATDIELFDQFPLNYLGYAKRQHRWIRGDWQISNWAFGRVPKHAGGKERNPLSALNKWKIFDNLRRSLVPIASMALLLAGWMMFPESAPTVTKFIVLAALVPTLTGVVTWLTTASLTRIFPWRDWAAGLGRALTMLALLPHQAGLSLDAIARVVYRRLISRKHLLEWQTSQDAASRARNLERTFLWRLAFISLLAGLVALYMVRATVNPLREVRREATPVSTYALQAPRSPLMLVDTPYSDVPPSEWPTRNTVQPRVPVETAVLWAAPLLLLWAFSPLLARWLSGGRFRTITQSLTLEDRRYLRQLSRQTWRYFDDFIGAQTHWLPPDNYQEYLNVEVAPRTSPTNIGLWLLSAMGARDFGYLSFDEVVDRCSATVETLGELELYDGHLLNWYDITTLKPLPPRYVSTVDSGNLLVSMWAFGQGCRAAIHEPVLTSSALHGLDDTLQNLKREMKAVPEDKTEHIANLEKLFVDAPSSLDGIVARLRAAGPPAYALTRSLREAGASSSFEPSIYWADALERQISAWNDVVDRYLLWAVHLAGMSDEQLQPFGDSAIEARRAALKTAPSLEQLANGEVAPLSTLLSFRSAPASMPAHLLEWLNQLSELSSKSRWLAAEKRAQAESLIEKNDALADAMNLRPLYDRKKGLFTIGLNVDAARLDTSYYDLLASECRLASFAAIARGDVPAEHWLKIRRIYASAGRRGQPAMLSWSGTMFEYLMPLLLTKAYPNSLLDHACHAAVTRQMDYGRQRGIPWGISEAAYSALDSNHTYQYQAFGVPGLGLKRGLEDDLVVAPYASCLAVQVEPRAAIDNLKRLENDGLRGSHGSMKASTLRARVCPKASAA
jgi:cyclic beta-1,2-glucan synthetase